MKPIERLVVSLSLISIGFAAFLCVVLLSRHRERADLLELNLSTIQAELGSVRADVDFDMPTADQVINQQNQINDLNESILNLTTQNQALRWDIDDLKIATRPQDEKTDPLDVEVSGDYPKWRLPYGVKIDDQRPPEVVAAAIERCKAGKGIVYMWLSFEQDNGRELRKYFGTVDWKDPAKQPKAKESK